MKSRLVILIFLLGYVSYGQTIRPYNETDFPAETFIIKKEKQTLGTLTVEIIQVRPKKKSDSQIPCRAWLTIKEKDHVVKELFQNMEALGGCSGFYFADTQPNRNLIVISKFSDYDGRLLIVDNKGELKDYLGGKYYLSGDGRFLFSNYDSDLSGTTIIDLTRNELIYTGQLEMYLADWYLNGGQYYAVISEDVIKNNETRRLVFDFTTKRFKEIRTKEKTNINDRLKVFNDPLAYTNCNCGK